MSRMKQNKNFVALPLSDWDISPWSKEMYERHEDDFRIIEKEYWQMREKYNDDARMARWRWIESKGGLRVCVDSHGFLHPVMYESKYQTTSNMFERFNDWLSFKEKRELTFEQRREKTEAIKKGMKRPNFSIPQNISTGAERDVKFEKEKHDDITQSALDNF